MRCFWDVPFSIEREFSKRLEDDLATLGQTLPANVRKAVVNACAVHDPDAPVITKKGEPEPDPDLRDAENVPLPEGFLDLDQDAQGKILAETAEQYLTDEIHPYVPDAWINHAKTKVGYEIPFTRQFYIYTSPRPVTEIDAELLALEDQIQQWMKGLAR
jgi:type I restriction enzyme M protein